MQSDLQEAVQAEVKRYGSLENAVEALRHDADAAPWGAPVHDIYKAALRLQSELRKVQAQTQHKDAA